MLQADTSTTGFQGYWPSSSPARARTRVRGFDEPPEGASGSAADSSSRTSSGSSCSEGEAASGRQKVTNLRLPGQYDERLFAQAGITGLQGRYYNWNRWYLPSVGRYLELDPVALGGGLNGPGTPDWYNYALGNPLRFTDREGTAVVVDDVILAGMGIALIIEYVRACTATNTCPWSPKKCEPMPWNPPRVDPIPIPVPLPWEATRPCWCTCLGRADPPSNPPDRHHGDRNVGTQAYPTACKEECDMRGFRGNPNSQCK